MRQVQGFTGLFIVKFTYPPHKALDGDAGDAGIWVCPPGKSGSVLQGKVGLSKFAHPTRSLTFFGIKTHFFASNVQFLHEISGNMINSDQNLYFVGGK